MDVIPRCIFSICIKQDGFDERLEEFNATEVCFDGDFLSARLMNGQNRRIPLRQVRRFERSKEKYRIEGLGL